MKLTIGALLLVCAYALLYPGLTQPVLSVSGEAEKVKLVEVGKQMIQDSPDTPALVRNLVDMVVNNLDVSGSVKAFDKTRSILGTAQELYFNQHRLVALLIVLFSIVIPLLKALLLLSLLLPVASRFKSTLLMISDALSKWSMADVFVIAIFIAYLAANGIQESNELVEFSASLGSGFWFFLGYCLVSILGTQLLSAGVRKKLSASKNIYS
ncbi:MAG: paraquat-inducible protein A [Granulosicoccus sp.]|nr:paraquat-inducible protein A [Granulosicoccus sp.]